MRALLVSTYDLGRQPFGLASPAAWLRRDGADVVCVDAARTRLRDEEIAAAGLVAFYLPMHTATRLAFPLIARVRRVNPSARVAAYGLYAQLNDAALRDGGVDEVFGPEAEEALTRMARRLGALHAPDDANNPNANNPNANNPNENDPNENDPNENDPNDPNDQNDPNIPNVPNVPNVPVNVLPRLSFIPPDRRGLPPLTEYARLRMPDGTERVAGATDASRGCKHTCRHCPIVPVYQGRFRVVPVEVVLADVAAQVAAGARHITFGDPDFLNGPAHARRVVEGFAAAHDDVTYDVTVKIEHLLKHADLLPVLRETGCLFVTSAVESVDDRVLERLAKGHTRADFLRVVDLCRRADLTLSPTFVPFTPWTGLDGYADLLDTIERLDLVEHVAPIQYAIRLLVTAASPLLELEEVRAVVEPFDRGSLTWPWRHEDPCVDRLQQEVMRLVGVSLHGSRTRTFGRLVELVRDAGGAVRQTSRPARDRATVPYLNEPWYC